MEVWKVGECILCPRLPSILPFLRPSLQQTRRFTSIRLSPSLKNPRRTQPPYRSLTTSSRRYAEDTPSAPTPSPDHQAKESPPTPNPSVADTTSEKLSSLLNDVLKPPSKPSSPPSSTSISETSASMLSSYMADVKRSEASSRAARQGQIFSAMNMPSNNAQQQQQIAGNSSEITLVPRAKRTIRSRPSVGRTIELGSAGLGVALNQLHRELRLNSIPFDQRRQKFHERRGLKKKRLKSERWNKRFRNMFRSALDTIKKMRRQGW